MCRVKTVAIVKKQVAVLGLADAHRIREHGLEHRLQSPGEELMTLSTSAVAVCCWRDSRSSLSSRVFSMAMTAWAAKFLTSSICFVGEWPYLLSVDSDRADHLVVFEQRDAKKESGHLRFPRARPARDRHRDKLSQS